MAYDENLAKRIRAMLAAEAHVTERRMFGGLSFMLAGNMCCGVVGGDLVARVRPDRYEDTLASPHARPMDFTGKPLKGFVYVAPAGCASDRALKGWIDSAAAFVRALPAK